MFHNHPYTPPRRETPETPLQQQMRIRDAMITQHRCGIPLRGQLELAAFDGSAVARWLLSRLPTETAMDATRERAVERYGFWLGAAAEDCA